MFSLTLQSPGNEQIWDGSTEFSICVLKYHLKLQVGSNIERHKSIWQDFHNSIYMDEMTSVQTQAEWYAIKYFMQKFLIQ